MPHRLARFVLLFALTLSGAAALVYQTSWTRMLNRVFGVGDLAVATILAAFFLGLGLGSYLVSRWSKRIRRPALTYVALEGAVALYAAISPWIVPALGRCYGAVGPDTNPLALSLIRLALALIVLLPPTLLMGATLPVVARIVGGRDGWARGVTGLYVANTLGAVIGAGLGGLILVPNYGSHVATWVAALASLATALLVAVSFRRSTPPAPTAAPEKPARTSDPASWVHSDGRRRAVFLAVSLAGLTGASALAGEVLWTRVLRGVLHGTTQAFAAMLVNYLFGIAMGALLARRVARTRLGPAFGLGVTQVLAALLSVGVMIAVPHVASALHGEPSPLEILLVSGALLLPLALVLGTGLPLAWSLAERIDPDPSRGTGRLLAANTFGGLAGALLAGWVLVPALGEASIFAVVFVHLLAAGLALRHGASQRSPAVRAAAASAPIVLGVLLLVLRPTLHLPFLLAARERAPGRIAITSQAKRSEGARSSGGAGGGSAPELLARDES